MSYIFSAWEHISTRFVRNAYTILVENPGAGNYFGNLDVQDSHNIKMTLKKGWENVNLFQLDQNRLR